MLRHRTALPVALAASLALALLTADLLLGGPLSAQDPGLSRWAAGQRRPGLTPWMLALDQWHRTLGVSLMTLAACAVLALRSRRREALGLLACVHGAMLLNVLLKTTLQRARPDSADALLHLATFSFPSGHALAATVWWGAVLVLTWPLLTTRPRRLAAASVAAALVAWVAASRVYLGVHFPTDVLAGITEGIAWLAACVLVGLLRPLGKKPG